MICPHCAFDNLPGCEQCGNCQADLAQLDQPMAQDRVERSLMEDPVAQLNPRKAVTLSPNTTVKHAIQIMFSQDVGAVLIVDEADKLVGIFSERDLLMKVALPDIDYTERPVSDFMTANPEAIRATDALAFVLHKMDCGGYRHLPVVAAGQPLAMISVRDMLGHITRMCETCGN